MSSKSKQAGSVAPKERINISYRPATGSAKESVELPFKVLVLGDFDLKEASDTLEDRALTNINNSNFDDVMAEMNLSVDFTVPDLITSRGGDIRVKIGIDKLADFDPDNIVSNVPELTQILELREALKSLKGPLGNSPSMRKRVQSILSDGASRKALMKEIGYKKSSQPQADSAEA